MKFLRTSRIKRPIRFLYVSTGLLFAASLGCFYLINRVGNLTLAVFSGVGITVAAVFLFRWLVRLVFALLLRRVTSDIHDIGLVEDSLSSEDAIDWFIPEFALVRDALAQKSVSIQHHFRVIREVSERLIATSSEIEAASGAHLAISNNQATSIVKSTSTVHNIRKSGESSRSQSHQIITLADQSVRISEEGLTAVESTNRVNLQINNQVRSIVTHTDALRAQVLESAQITERIKEISGRLGILSVNAAIEAAKAGIFGRGFNVVAQEIKILNAQSKQATKDVMLRLKNIENTTQDVLDAANAGFAESLSGIESIGNAKLVIQQLSDIINNSVKNANAISESFDTQMSGIYRLSDEMKTLNVSAMSSVKGTMQIKEQVSRIKKVFAEFQGTAVLLSAPELPEDEQNTMEGEI